MKLINHIIVLFVLLTALSNTAYAGSSLDYYVGPEGIPETGPVIGGVTGAGGTNEGGSQGVQTDEFTGAATYSIPIAIPPGRGGIDPKISLNYNSYRKNPNSWVGYGWEMELGSIVRISDRGNVDYVKGQKFEYRLMGQSETLVLISADVDLAQYGLTGFGGGKGDLYSAKVDSARNIYLHIKSGATDYGWCVIDKAGRKYFFGGKKESRDQKYVDDRLWIASWLIDKVIDGNGNEMNVNYSALTVDGVAVPKLLPDSIIYNDIKIEFNKSELDDPNVHYFPNFRQGFLNRYQVRRLEGITVSKKGFFGIWIRLHKVALAYKNSKLNAVPLLASITKHGKSDAETLPPIKINYFEGDKIEFGKVWVAKASYGTSGGFLNDLNRAFVDMNGDALPDQAIGEHGSARITVRLNNYNGFDATQDWPDPFAFVPEVNGRLNVEAAENDHRYVFLVDMNGDGLPDRVMRTFENNDTGSDTAYFAIAFNTGSGFEQTPTAWKDPYKGEWAGTIGSDKGLIDMNGDGLVDRIVGKGSGFNVWYNSGAGFKTPSVFWKDPMSAAFSDNPAVGKIRYYKDGKLYVDIRDMNGDSLPDRVNGTIIYTGDGVVHKGLSVRLNLNGNGWAEPKVITCPGTEVSICVGYDSNEILGIIDPGTSGSGFGFISDASTDLIDFNGDGYLDRIAGDPSSGKFKIYFYKGIAPDSDEAHFSTTPLTLTDPALGEGEAVSGYVSSGFSGFVDINGDNYPDRVSVKKDGEFNNYQFYPMSFDAIGYSDNLMSFNNYPKMSQPSNGLKDLDNGQGFKTATEYFSSSYPLQFDKSTHTFLPASLYLVHKLYRQDPTVPIDMTVEALRHPNMRFVTYWYYGGNIFVRYAQKGSGDSLKEEYVSRFNGFQHVEKIYAPMSSETWVQYKEILKFHQALGDVAIAKKNKYAYFEEAGYSHFALTGKMYRKELKEGTLVRKKESFTWDVNASSTNPDYTNINCTTKACTVKLSLREMITKEPASPALAVTTKTSYVYDDNLNVIQENYYANSSLKLSTASVYFPSAQFGNLQIRDRLKERVASLGGEVFRKKSFHYDAHGNPIKEASYTSASKSEEIVRKFNAVGNIISITGADGVKKAIDYDSSDLFPIKDTITLESGGTIETKREYDRLTGRPRKETNQSDVGKKIAYDAFGRVTAEYLVRSDGILTGISNLDYEYIDVNVDGALTRVLKTRYFRTQPGYSETMFSLPYEITYTDGAGFVLQRCTLSERASYRVIYARRYNAGRLQKETEPIFSANCGFAQTPTPTEHVSSIERDLFGRPVKITPPAGDAESPTEPITIAYKQEFGQRVRDITLPKNQKKLESYDTMGRLVKVTGSVNDTILYAYNPVGDLLTATSAGKKLIEAKYDLLGRKVETVDADMGKWQYVYDQFGRLITQTDASNQKTQFTYDNVSRVTKKMYYKSDGLVEKFENYAYDAGESGYDVKSGELANVIEKDGSGKLLRESKFSYDPLYRRIAKMSRDTQGLGEFAQTFVHNSIGQVSNTIYNDGQQVYYTYNIIGGLKQVCDNGACSGEIYYEIEPNTGYNAQGSLLEEWYGNGVKGLYEYYAKSHRMSKKAIGLDDKTYYEKKFTYDSQSNITSLTDPLKLVGAISIKSASYDNANRLKTADLTGASSISMNYDALGNMLKNSTVYGANTYVYGSTKPHAVTQIGTENFTYDANGNMTSDAYRTMSYNTANQLKQVTMKNGAVVEYDYDYAGTRVMKKVSTKDTYNKAVEYTVHYLGNAIEIKPATDEVILHIYAEGKLIATKYAGKVSDTFGSLVGGWRSLRAPILQSGVTITHIQIALLALLLVAMFPRCVIAPVSRSFGGSPRRGCGNPVHACHSRGSGNLAYALAYRLAAVALIVIIVIHPTISLAGDAGIPLSKISDVDYLIYHHGDHLGSTHLITEGKQLGRHAGISFPQGSVIQRFEYLPWGQEAFALNPNLSYDPRFTGQEYDIETGLYFYKSRYYNPALGRFIQPDSIVSDPTDPQSYNRYAYVRNNPLKYTDPSGHAYEQFNFTDDDTGEPLHEQFDRGFENIGHEAYENAVEVGVIEPSTSGGLVGNTTNANRNDYMGAYDNNYSESQFGFDYGGGGGLPSLALRDASALNGGGFFVPEAWEMPKLSPGEIPKIPSDVPGWYKYAEGVIVGAPVAALAVTGGAVAVAEIAGSSAYAAAMSMAATPAGQEVIKLGSSFVSGFSSGYYDVKLPPTANTPMNEAASRLGSVIGNFLRKTL